MNTLSIIVPVYNEAAGIAKFNDRLTKAVELLVDGNYEIIYCNDGSYDETAEILLAIAHKDTHCRVLSLSKNFGKESAIFAGIQAATGQAVLLIDGDGQHPISAIPEFYKEWKSGAQVVIGRRSNDDKESFSKKIVSKLFYTTYNFITGNKLDANATDYRLLDREVVDAYLRLPETNRLNRFLIDWLGFQRAYVSVDREQRIAGTSKFTARTLIQLALDTMVSSSTRPLHILLLIGFIIMVGSFLLGLTVGIEQVILGDPMGWKFTGTALLGIMILFLVGLLLISQGIVSLYTAASYRQVKQRPLYIINKRLSYNVTDRNDK
jgi:glycosyltransferase involved in cell wall biosynthesis